MEVVAEEEWKVVVDEKLEEGRYLISSKGKVYDNRHKQNKPVQDNGFGYKKTAFSLPNNRTVNRYIHRMVAIAFIPNPENLPQVGHKDHDKDNNCVENLYWTTQKQNTKDGIEAGRINAKKRGKTNQLTPHQLEEIVRKRVEGMGVGEISRSMNLPRTTVSSVLNGRSYWELVCSYLKKYQHQDTLSGYPENL